ncbi:MAG TPA: type II secretion system protein [Planctomycetota bacterium]|nr:type II secretion system protein [Planctomycetota bacterium]
MTLIEVMVALAVLAIGIMGVMSALISITALENADHEELVAINIARQKFAELQAAPFASVFNYYGPSSTKGTFTVDPALNLQNGVGTITFPVNSSGNLDETVVDANMGMPMDLDGNGKSTDTNVSGTYTLLPVRINLTWTSTTGTRTINFNAMLTQLK